MAVLTDNQQPMVEPADLRARRKTARLSTYELAQLLDVSPAAVQHWEAGRKRVPPGRASELMRVLAARAPARAPEMPGSELKHLREARDLGQGALARLLGVKQPTVAEWEAGEVPEARREVLREALGSEAPVMGALLRALRRRAGLKQAELGELVGATQNDVTSWERGVKPVPEERWPAIREALESADRGPQPEHFQRPLTAEELREGVRRLNWTLGQLAEAIGVSRGAVGPWSSGAKRIPPERWAQIRAVLGTAAPAPAATPRDRVAEALPLALAAIEADPGVGRAELVKRVDAPEPHARAAVARALEQDRIHERRVPHTRADGVVRFLPGLFPGPRPAELPHIDRASLVVPEVLPAVEAAPGRTRRQVADALPHDRRLAERAIDRAVREGLVHERAVAARTRGGARTYMGLFPGATPATAEPIAGDILRRLRERLIIGRAELALLLGVGVATVQAWEESEVEPAWRDAVAAALRPVGEEAQAREADRRRRLVEAVAAEPGLPRWGELARHLRPVERPHLRRLLDELVAAGELHERPAANGHGAGLFPGPPPPEWEPGLPISAAELSAMRDWAGLTQKELAARIGASVASVNAWEQGTKPVPPYRRPQLRQALAERKPPEPALVTPEELRAERRRTGLTQPRIAAELGVTQGTVSAWERGDRRTPPELRERLRAFLAAAPTAPRVSGNELRRWRRAQGLTLQALGEMFGVAESTAAEWQQRGVSLDRAAAVRAAIDRDAPAQGTLFEE